MNSIGVQFGLESDKDIIKFFPKEKTIADRFVATLHRMQHYWNTGVWIDEQKICDLATSCKKRKLSVLFTGCRIERKLIRIETGGTLPKQTVADSVKATVQFVYQFVKNPTTVGAIFPSSPQLAKEIVSELTKDLAARPRMILEVGPGTGSFTDKIIKRMNPNDTLHLVEFDKEFADSLRKKYAHLTNVRVFHRSILDYAPRHRKYDCIISGLPLNAFTVDFVKQAFDKFRALSKENTTLSYFEYLGVPSVKRLLSSPQEKENLDAVLEVKKQFYKANKLRKQAVLLNLPCARVRHHKMNP